MRLVRLEELEKVKPFDCGDNDLNGFFYDDALYYHKEMIASTFVMEDDDVTIAYFSLLQYICIIDAEPLALVSGLWLAWLFCGEAHTASLPIMRIKPKYKIPT